jgi:hypothetical protein
VQFLRLFRLLPVSGPAPEVVTRRQGKWADSGLAEQSQAVFDVVVCGGTLGVFLATALALRGMKVAIVEKGPLRGVSAQFHPNDHV